MFEEFQVKNGIDGTATEGMRDPYPLPMRLTVHHPKVNVPVLWWRSVGSTHTAFVMETLLDDIARATKQDPVAYRMGLFGDKHPRHRAALQLAVDKSGYGKQRLPDGRAWGVAVHESFDSVVAYVVEAERPGAASCDDPLIAVRELPHSRFQGWRHCSGAPQHYSAAIASGGWPAGASTSAGFVAGRLTRNQAA